MGRPKLSIPVGDELLLTRVVRILSQVAGPIAVVAAIDQDLPALPPEVLILRDVEPHLGPLAGLAIALKALQRYRDAAYVTACDTPLLSPDFIRTVASHLRQADAVLVREGDRLHPLAAVYRTRLASSAELRVQQRQLKLLDFVASVSHVEVNADTLLEVDPELRSLMNINTEADLARVSALAEQG